MTLGTRDRSDVGEDLSTYNGARLLASTLKSECQRYRELVARAGRKTVRIADPSPQRAAPSQQ